MQTALLTGGLWLFLRADGKIEPAWHMALVLALAFLTRPDAAVPIAVIMIFRAIGLIKKPGWLRPLLIEAGILAGFVVGLTLFRLAYYGVPFPNTYYLKVSGVPLGVRLEGGIVYIQPFLTTIAFPLAIALFSALTNWNRRFTLMLSLVLAGLAYQVYVGGDPFVYWRMLVPYAIFLLVVIVSEGFKLTSLAIKERAEKTKKGFPQGSLTARILPTATVLLWVAFLTWHFNWKEREEILLDKKAPTVVANGRNVQIALALADITTPEATLGVTWAGAIPYYAERNAVDFLGKSDKYIAALPPHISPKPSKKKMRTIPGHNKFDLNYSIKKLKPTYVQTMTWAQQDLTDYVRQHYRRVRHRNALLWLRKDSPNVKWDKLE